MKVLKRSVTVTLLLFVGATVGMLIAQEASHPAVESTADAPTAGPAAVADAEIVATSATSASEESEQEVATIEDADVEPSCVVDAIYFHNTLRCRTCRNIEETARAVLEAEFSDEFASGRMRWSAINMERQQHYVGEYDLVKPTLILVRSVGDERSDWVTLDETWSLIRYGSRFSEYVKGSTRDFLEACP